MESDKTRSLILSYYEGLSKGEDWSGLLSDDFLITGTLAKESLGRESYRNLGFFKMVEGPSG